MVIDALDLGSYVLQYQLGAKRGSIGFVRILEREVAQVLILTSSNAGKAPSVIAL